MNGDLIKLAKEGTFDLIAHGCNCKGLMGAGIALQVAKEFPSAKYADLKYKGAMKDLFGVELHEKAMLGSLSMYEHQKVTVLNLYTQIETGPNFDLKRGLCPALCQIDIMFKRGPYDPKPKIGFPRIGSGIGGGNEGDVENYINSVLGKTFEITIVDYVPDEPKKGVPTAIKA